MSITTVTARQFNQHPSEARKSARLGPVFITDRGRPSQVLLSIEEYQRLTGREAGIIDLLAMPGVEDIDFEPSRLDQPLVRPQEFVD